MDKDKQQAKGYASPPYIVGITDELKKILSSKTISIRFHAV